MYNYLDELMHYGVGKQEWYVHKFGNWERQARYANGQPNPETVAGIKTNSYNMSSWGSDRDHNTLFITGYSGSGKSTIAQSMKNDKTNVINLDLFIEQNDSKSERDKEFVKYLKDTGSDYYKISEHNKYGIKIGTSKFGTLLDNFEKSIDEFSREQFDKGKRVVVEGMQLTDETLYPDKSYFKDKPLIITKTNKLASFVRSGIRDDKLKLKDLTPTDIKEYIRWYNQMANGIKNIKMNMIT